MNFKMQATKITQVENFNFADERTLSQDNSNSFLCFTKTLFKESVFDELKGYLHKSKSRVLKRFKQTQNSKITKI